MLKTSQSNSRKKSLLVMVSLAMACLLAAWPRPTAAYIKFPPTTLGDMCRQAIHIYVLRVEKFSAEKGVILFQPVRQLKALEALPEGALSKHVLASEANGAKVILDWAAEGKTAIMFARDVKAHVYIDGYWYSALYEGKSKCWVAANGEPALLTRYCGTVDQLGDAVTKILRGEEVVVPAMVGDNPRDLEQRRAKIQELRASLKILGAAEVRKPDRVGTIRALSTDGKSFTLQPAPTEKNKKPAPIEIQIREDAKIMTGLEAGKLTVGQTVNLWFAKGSANVAVEIQIGKLPEPSEKKPAPEDKGKKPAPDATEKKPDEPKKEPAKPARDPAPTAAFIDAEVDRQLASLKVPASSQADDAEFLCRVTLDLTGRIPSYQQTVGFLDSKDPDKRRKLIDELLESPEYGEHFGTVWRNLIGARPGQSDRKGRGRHRHLPILARGAIQQQPRLE